MNTQGMNTHVTNSVTLASWRVKGFGILRIVFGFFWAVDAWFKWQPGFVNKFVDYLSSALEGQPIVVQTWINFWINIIKVDPRFFAYLVAIGETAVAIGLIFGLFTNLTYIVGTLLSVAVWTTAEGFGGPYIAGTVDIGAALIYVPVFAGLFLANAGLYYGVDCYLTPFLRRLGFLAAGPTRMGASKV